VSLNIQMSCDVTLLRQVNNYRRFGVIVFRSFGKFLPVEDLNFMTNKCSVRWPHACADTPQLAAISEISVFGL
jgi:hypothetical protein